MNVSFFFIKVNKISISKIKKYAEIGSPWRAPIFNWKYCVVFPLLIMQNSDLFKMASIQSIKLVAKLKFLIKWEQKNDLMNQRPVQNPSH